MPLPSGEAEKDLQQPSAGTDGPEDGERVLSCGHLPIQHFLNVPRSNEFPFNWILLCASCIPLKKGMRLFCGEAGPLKEVPPVPANEPAGSPAASPEAKK